MEVASEGDVTVHCPIAFGSVAYWLGKKVSKECCRVIIHRAPVGYLHNENASADNAAEDWSGHRLSSSTVGS